MADGVDRRDDFLRAFERALGGEHVDHFVNGVDAGAFQEAAAHAAAARNRNRVDQMPVCEHAAALVDPRVLGSVQLAVEAEQRAPGGVAQRVDSPKTAGRDVGEVLSRDFKTSAPPS